MPHPNLRPNARLSLSQMHDISQIEKDLTPLDYFQVRAEKGKKVKIQSRNSDLPVFGQQILESATIHCL